MGAIRLVHPYATPSPPGRDIAAVYIGLENRGARPDRLIGADADVARKASLHEMSQEGGVARMRYVEAIDLAPGASLVMTPRGGMHVMLEGLKSPLNEGDRFVLNLRFEHAGRTSVSVWVQPLAQGETATQAHYRP